MFMPSTDIGQYAWILMSGVSSEDEAVCRICNLLDEHPPKGIAIDIGANFGIWSLPLSQHCTEVISYEPQQCCYDLLSQTIKANDITNVQVRYKAIGAAPDIVQVPQLDINKDANFGGVSLVKGAISGFGFMVEDDRGVHLDYVHEVQQPDAPLQSVPMVTLDDEFWLIDKKITFIKMDIEGGEFNAIRGGRSTILRNKPFMFIEAFSGYVDVDELAQYIAKMGYVIDIYGPNLLCLPI